jgi:predicted DNA-binding transcriptional regulator AlpA
MRKKSTATPDPQLSLLRDSSIMEFCQRRGWSKSFFYKQLAAGRAPKLTKSGRKSSIRAADEIAWDQARSAEAAQ